MKSEHKRLITNLQENENKQQVLGCVSASSLNV